MRRVFISLPIFVLAFLQHIDSYAEDLKIGAALSLSGPYANYGTQALHGIELAINEVNESGGVNGRKIKLIVEDEGTLDLRRATAAAHKLVDADKVDVLLPLIVEDSEVIVPITSRVPIFTMVVGCGARKCGFNLGKYNVRAPSSHDAIIQKLTEYINSQGAKHSCVIASESTYFEAYGRLIEEIQTKAGKQVTYAAVPLSNTEDYRDVATRFKAKECDAIFSWIPMGSIGSFFRRVREIGSKAILVGIVETDDPQILNAAGKAAEGVVFARFSLGSKAFQKRFKERYSEMPSRPAIPAYDGVKLLLKLIGKVGTDAKALREAILAVQNETAENGIMRFTSEGDREGEQVELMQIRDGIAHKIQ